MDFAGNVTGAFVAFAVICLAIVLFSYALVKYFEDRHEGEPLVTATCVVGLTTCLATIFLIPVDVYITAGTTDLATGLKHPWATPDFLSHVQLGLKIAYYVLYSCVVFGSFVVIPWVYFYFEEGGGEDSTFKRRALSATKYTAATMITVSVLFVAALLLKTRNDDSPGDIEWLEKLLGSGVETPFIALIGVLITLGLLVYVSFTSLGLSLLPIRFIQAGSANQINQDAVPQLAIVQERLRAFRAKCGREGLGAMNRREKGELEELERKERDLQNRVLAMERANSDFWVRFWNALKPFMIFIGTIVLLLSLSITFAILLACIDKIKNSFCGASCGWMLDHPRFYNPVNWLLLRASKYFPLDTLLLLVIIMYLFFCTLVALTRLGIRCLCIPLYTIRHNATSPQGLLLGTMLMMLVTVAYGYVVLVLAPQWGTFGVQRYCDLPSRNCSDDPSKIRPCTMQAPTSLCTPTTISTIINRTTYTFPLFGTIFYWAQWAFLAVFVVGMVGAIAQPDDRHGEVSDDDEEDMERQALLARATAARR
ncbi:hypothetical protein SpCBS45565_g06321 [Spizellomyces sp. 'palustris']|nr:hypothetical protein SpCBS45565_g06321 [Spizellomyces sp. 'palustris']